MRPDKEEKLDWHARKSAQGGKEMKTKMKNIAKRGISMALIIAMSALLLMGCSGTKLSGDYDEEKVKAVAQEAIDHLVAGEYEE